MTRPFFSQVLRGPQVNFSPLKKSGLAPPENLLVCLSLMLVQILCILVYLHGSCSVRQYNSWKHHYNTIVVVMTWKKDWGEMLRMVISISSGARHVRPARRKGRQFLWEVKDTHSELDPLAKLQPKVGRITFFTPLGHNILCA